MLDLKPWLIVFDLDGTLIDSSLDLCLSVNAALEHVGDPPLPHEMIAGYIGDGAAMLMRRALGDPDDLDSNPGTSDASGRKFQEAFTYFLLYYRQHKLDNTKLYEGVLPALEQIKKCAPETLMAVLTNKPVGPSREICDALGVGQFLFANYGGDSFVAKKPDPRGLQTLIEEASSLAEDVRHPLSTAVMVGDSAVDVLTAKRAGIRSLGCRYGLAPQTLEQSRPDLFCDSPEAWPHLLGFVSPI